MRYGDELRSFVKEIFIFINDQLAAFVHRDDANSRTLCFSHHLPWNDIRMMFHLTKYDFIARAKEFSSVTMRYEIDRFGCSANENTLLRFFCIDKFAYFFACGFVGGRCFLRKIMNSAMDIRMFFLEVCRAALYNHIRNLGRCGVIQIPQRLSIYLLREHGKIFTDFFDLEVRHFFYLRHTNNQIPIRIAEFAFTKNLFY